MKKHWFFSILLTLPLVLFYVAHYCSPLINEELVATGFVHPDMASYMSNAKEYGERGGFSLQYPLPFTDNYDNEAIYFQPQIFLFGQLMRLFPIDPGILLVSFGFIFTVLCIRMCIQLYAEVIGIEKETLGLFGPVLFIWGGGILFLLGSSLVLLMGQGMEGVLRNSFFLDPSDGWWILNLGRNFIFPLEAYYHFVFFALVYFVYKERYRQVLYLLALLIVSHPYTGTAALLILSAWVVLEHFYTKKIAFSNAFLVGLLLLFAFNFGYYFIYLPSDLDHQIIMEQWAMDWSMKAKNFIPAYFIVGLLVFARISTPLKLQKLLSSRFNRFLLVWAIVNFLLENHEFAFSPHQPLHFSRGYTWSALFLLGYPAIKGLYAKLHQGFSAKGAKLLLFGVILLFLSDNIAWFTQYSYGQLMSEGTTIKKVEKEVLDFLGTLEAEKRVLLCNNRSIAYLSTIHTDFRPYFSHYFNAPHAEDKKKAQKAFYKDCTDIEGLKGRKAVVVYRLDRLDRPICHAEASAEMFRNERFGVYEVVLD